MIIIRGPVNYCETEKPSFLLIFTVRPLLELIIEKSVGSTSVRFSSFSLSEDITFVGNFQRGSIQLGSRAKRYRYGQL